MVHGYNDSGTSEQSLKQAAEIQKRNPGANVVIVDAQEAMNPPPNPYLYVLAPEILKPLALKQPDYVKASANTRVVGEQIARWMKEKGVRPSNTEVSGHSLGAHTAAFASNELAKPEFFGERVDHVFAEELRDLARLVRELDVQLRGRALELRLDELRVRAGLLTVEDARADLDRVGHSLGVIVARLLALAHDAHGALVLDVELPDDEPVADHGHV